MRTPNVLATWCHEAAAPPLMRLLGISDIAQRFGGKTAVLDEVDFGLQTVRTPLGRGIMGHELLLLINLLVSRGGHWEIIDVARRPSSALAGKWKALWIAGMIGGWFLFGIIGAIVSVFYLAGPRKRLNADQYSNRY